MAGKKNSGSNDSGTATLAPLNAVQAAEQAAAEARQTAITDLNSQREGLVEQMEALAGQIGEIDNGLEGLGVEEFNYIDLSSINYCVDTGSAPKRQRRSSGGSSSGARGSKPTTLANAVLITMNQRGKGTDFSIDEVSAGVQEAPVSYPFSGEADTINTQISQTLGKLVKSGHVSRPERGVYRITGTGQTAAKAALSAMNEKQSSE